MKQISNAQMNPWYMPSVPTTILSFGDICRAYQDLFGQMTKKTIRSIDKAVEYSLVLTIELDFNSKEEKLFNECTDSSVKADPQRYCQG